MFVFGLFSTHLPYLVLMGLYLVGFGVYSSAAIKEKLGLVENEQHTIVVSKTQQAQFSSNTVFYFHNKIQKQTNAVVQKHIFYWAIKYQIQAQIHTKYDFPQNQHLGHNLFSRPPPAQFI